MTRQDCPLRPKGAIWKVGPGEPFFYSDGEFSVETTRGQYRVLVERGTEYTPWQTTVHVGKSEVATLDIALERWSDLPARGWHPGNTHIHYDENETLPDERLAYDSRIEDLRMTAISILKRWDLEYATNKYAPGVMNQYTDTHHYVQCGEETRHNSNRSHEIGYGHVMLLNIRNVVDPLSRGLLVDRFEPDYPTVDLCLRRRQPAGRPGDLVSQRAGYGGPGRRRAGQAARVQPLRPALDRRRVRHLLPDAQLRVSACPPRPAQTGSYPQPTGSTPSPATRSRTKAGCRP